MMVKGEVAIYDIYMVVKGENYHVVKRTHSF